jgi:glutathione peroxidase
MMKSAAFIAGVWAFSGGLVVAETCPDVLNVKMNKLRSSEQIDFCQAFQGKVILAVNTASNCGYTPQFKGLETLYKKYKDKGLVVVGFPSNDFNQEFAEAEKTANVCYINYGVTFPMMETSQVKGAGANALFQKLINATHEAPAWNFHKYLIDRNGTSIAAFASNVTPEQLDSKISALLLAP